MPNQKQEPGDKQHLHLVTMHRSTASLSVFSGQTMVTMFSRMVLLASVCRSQNDAAADYYIAGNCSVSGEDRSCSSGSGLIWAAAPGAEASNSTIRIDATDRKFGAVVFTNSLMNFPKGYTSTMRMTLYGRADADADLVIVFTDLAANFYFSMSLPLYGEASAYNNSIGPQCDIALVPNATSDTYAENGIALGNDDTGEILAVKVGALAAEMQPPSKVNAWPIVVEIEHHGNEGYFIARVSSDGSDVVQQCGFAQELVYNAQHNFWFGAGDDGQNLRLDSVFLELWYNDTDSPTVSPTDNPSVSPTVPTVEPTTTPTQEPTGMPTQEPIVTGAPSEDPTMGPTPEPIQNGDGGESSEDSGDDGLAIGLGVAGRVVVLLVFAIVA